MTMAGSRQVIAEVTRPSTGYELHAFDAEQTREYTAENPYVQDYGGKAYFWVSSNADWIVESSESLDLSKTNGGSIIIIKNGEIYASVNPDVDAIKNDKETRNWLSKYIDIVE